MRHVCFVYLEETQMPFVKNGPIRLALLVTFHLTTAPFMKELPVATRGRCHSTDGDMQPNVKHQRAENKSRTVEPKKI